MKLPLGIKSKFYTEDLPLGDAEHVRARVQHG